MKQNRETAKKEITELQPLRTISASTKKRLDELYKKDIWAFAKFLQEKTGITMVEVTAQQFIDERGNLVGDTLYDDVDDILTEAGVEVMLA